MYRSVRFAVLGAGPLLDFAALMLMKGAIGCAFGVAKFGPGHALDGALRSLHTHLELRGLAATAFVFWFVMLFVGHRVFTSPVMRQVKMFAAANGVSSHVARERGTRRPAMRLVFFVILSLVATSARRWL